MLVVAVVAGAVVTPGVGSAAVGANPVYRVHVNEREVALTLDDGPDPRYTPLILADLHRYGANATFFVIGTAAEKYPGLVKREIADGNEVGVHTFDKHVRFPTIASAAGDQQIDLARMVVTKVTGEKPKLFRPPYGAWRPWVVASAEEQGMRTILWSVAFDHRSARTPRAVSNRVLSLVRPGEILLMHDARGNRRKTTSALPMVLRELKRRGYKVVTVSHLLADSAAGK
jgi:peptidoglycan/xylan/chitin deacetylase (PgdA/CDA1 family)